MDIEPISSWMQTNVVTIEPTKTVKQAAKLMDAHDIGTLVIVDGRKPLGIFTERDILRQIVAMDINPANVEVGTFMTREVITVHEDANIAEVSRIMTLHHVKRVPVVNNEGELTGIISSTDLLKTMAEKLALGK